MKWIVVLHFFLVTNPNISITSKTTYWYNTQYDCQNFAFQSTKLLLEKFDYITARDLVVFATCEKVKADNDD